MEHAVRRALVVDDSRLARIALTRLLQRREVEVEVVGTGGEAVEFLRGEQPDVVFMDYMMPDMDGFEATRQLREIAGLDLPVVMYTSQDTSEDRERARQLGITGFLSKPSGEQALDEVLEAVARHAETIAAQAEAAQAGEAEAAGAQAAEARSDTSAQFGDARVSDARASAASAYGVVRRAASGGERAAPPPAPEAPAGAEPPWERIRELARESAEGAARVAARESLAEEIDDLLAPHVERLRGEVREGLERSEARARELAGEAADDASRQAAEAAAREAAQGVAEQAAKLISDGVAQETARRVAEEVGPEAARRIMADLRRDIREYMAELLAADAFRDQILDALMDAAAERLRDAVAREVAPRLRDEITASAIASAEERAVAAAREAGREAAEAAVETLLHDQVEVIARERTAELEARLVSLRRQLMATAGAAVVVSALALVLAFLSG
ncbi:response regulator [Spiribacter halobius]|uniref:Response regulatory domain-containing protein n=1 Tax=Sediminicurvatus halobius TaxID=2182432 RepID=A0A2U2N1Z6_9GAMM|nr:response regulator [Spiribacter halobius]PWG63120.1 hypothetical protein DEM34_09725 [Spiribacter halobius]UEX77569.1 response regulator [Spiribacter halobius]